LAVAFVSFYLGDKKVSETIPTAVTPNAASRLGTVSLNFNIKLSKLTPGEYTCQVTVLDPSAQKAAFGKPPFGLSLDPQYF